MAGVCVQHSSDDHLSVSITATSSWHLCGLLRYLCQQLKILQSIVCCFVSVILLLLLCC